MNKKQITLIPSLYAGDFPESVEEWCINNNIELHDQNDIFTLDWDEASPMTEYLYETFGNDIMQYNEFAVWAT